MRRPTNRTRLLLVLLPVALAGCALGLDEVRRGEPAMRAVFPVSSEQATACLSRAWESARLTANRLPLKVESRVIAGSGTIVVGLPQVDGTAWLVDVARQGEGASAVAWSHRVGRIDLEPSLAAVMRQAVGACGGEITDDRLERNARRRVASL
jgi:hypothetical protein